MWYFAITSITTVGLGDMVPKSDAERLYSTFFLLIAFTISNAFVGHISTMFKKFERLFEDNDQN